MSRTLDQRTKPRNGAENRLSTAGHVQEAPIRLSRDRRRLVGVNKVMNELIPSFMEPALEQRPPFKSGSSKRQDFTQALARDGVAVIAAQIPDFGAFAAGIIRQTVRSLPGRGRPQVASRQIPEAQRKITFCCCPAPRMDDTPDAAASCSR